MGARNKPRPYDPTWAVELARQQCPSEPWLVESLAACTTSYKKSRGKHKKLIYVEFVDSAKVAAMIAASSQGFVTRTISLEHSLFGHVKLNMLADNRVLGIEFYDRLFSSGKPRPEPDGELPS